MLIFFLNAGMVFVLVFFLIGFHESLARINCVYKGYRSIVWKFQTLTKMQTDGWYFLDNVLTNSALIFCCQELFFDFSIQIGNRFKDFTRSSLILNHIICLRHFLFLVHL